MSAAAACTSGPVERLVERLLVEDDRPLTTARPVATRLAGNCRQFTVLLVAMLRVQGVPARARCGFGAYFNPGHFVDHWVCEYWNVTEARWVLVDPQLDEVWRAQLQIEHVVLDLPHDRFLSAGDAWAQCRASEADPSRFGIVDMNGLWFIAGNLVRDAAALNNMELLPWDDWGAMPAPDEPLHDEQLVLFDPLAALTRTPDGSFAELRTRYEADDRLRVPATVFNAVLHRSDASTA